jgi:predicted PurR-regulated permease PerM
MMDEVMPPSADESDKPVWSTIQARHLFTIFVLAAIAFGLYVARDALGPFILAIVLAYLLLPLVKKVESFIPADGRAGRIARPVSTMLALVATVIAIALIITYIARPVAEDMQQLADNFSLYWDDLTEGQAFGDWYVENVPLEIQTWLDENVESLGHTLLTAVSSVLTFLVQTTSSTIGAIASFVIVPVFMVYFLLDLPKAERVIRQLLPEQWVDDSLEILSLSDSIMSRYTQGVVLTSVLVGFITGFGYWLIGVELWVALGAIAFIGEIVPILGPWIAFFISFPIILVTQPDKAIPAAVLFGIVQALEGWFISPKIQGDSIQLPASMVLVALAIGGAIAGAIGVVLALPAVAILRALVVYTMNRLDGLRPSEASNGIVEGAKPTTLEG